MKDAIRFALCAFVLGSALPFVGSACHVVVVSVLALLFTVAAWVAAESEVR